MPRCQLVEDRIRHCVDLPQTLDEPNGHIRIIKCVVNPIDETDESRYNQNSLQIGVLPFWLKQIADGTQKNDYRYIESQRLNPPDTEPQSSDSENSSLDSHNGYKSQELLVGKSKYLQRLFMFFNECIYFILQSHPFLQGNYTKKNAL